LLAPLTWILVREEWLEEEPQSVAYAASEMRHRLAREIKSVLDLLTPAEVKLYFGVNRKQRNYICLKCARETDLEPDYSFNFAQLTPNTPQSEKVTCFVCRTEEEVSREQCPHCPANVIAEGMCLSCGESIE